MKRRTDLPLALTKNHAKEIRHFSDRQINWACYVPILKKFEIQTVDSLSIPGDAPKDFISDREYRPGHRSRRRSKDRYIAKVGSKYYPLESITEQLITEIGQIFNLDISESKIRIVSGQVRFLSKYFLKAGEQLTHGAEIYEYSLGKENYAELVQAKSEADYFSYQMTCEAIKDLFPEEFPQIIAGYVEMLTFDALIGHNDRHPYNWGVIVPLRKDRRIRFSPVYDTARALFWNKPENKVVKMLSDQQSLDAYIRNCTAPIGWESQTENGWKRSENIDFFELIALIWNACPELRPSIDKFLDDSRLPEVNRILDNNYAELFSQDRRELIKRCLHLRQERLRSAIKSKSL